MRAVVLAAGLATRMGKIREQLPKALVPVAGQTLLQRTLKTLVQAGATDIVVNIHHHPRQMQEAIKQYDFPGVRIRISDETSQLLDTGGGIRKAAGILGGTQPIVIHNVDILHHIDLQSMWQTHMKEKPLATLAVSQRSSSRCFHFCMGQLCGWENTGTGEIMAVKNIAREGMIKKLAFSGIHIIHPSIFENTTNQEVFSINALYLEKAAVHRIMAYEHSPAHWADVGTPEKLRNAEAMLIRAGNMHTSISIDNTSLPKP